MQNGASSSPVPSVQSDSDDDRYTATAGRLPSELTTAEPQPVIVARAEDLAK